MRRRVEWWSAGFGACALVGAFYHYTLIVTGFLTKGVVQSVLLNTVNGHENAPYQYRFLVPCVLVWLHDHAGISLESATTAVDGAMLVIGAALGVSLLRRSGLAQLRFAPFDVCAGTPPGAWG